MKSFSQLVNNRFAFSFFLMKKLPVAYLSGVRVRHFSAHEAITSVPYKWLTQNPFRSTYFASLAMAAEMSTGILAMNCIYQRVPGVSMLVTGMQAQYFKKATGTTYFTCNQGEEIADAIERTASEPAGTTITVRTVGTNRAGERIAEFSFTWSFRQKSFSGKTKSG